MNLKLKNNSTTVLLKVTDNDHDIVRCNYAIATISKELLERISKLRKAREEVGAYEVVDFCGCANLLNQDEFAYQNDEENISEELAESLEDFTKDNEGVWQIDANEIGDIDNVPMIRTTGDTIHVCEFGVKFTAYMKYADNFLETEKISWEQIDSMKF